MPYKYFVREEVFLNKACMLFDSLGLLMQLLFLLRPGNFKRLAFAIYWFVII